MSKSLSHDEFHAISGSSADERYDYFVDAVIQWQQVWTLSSDKGTVLMSSEGEDCLPVWPHSDFASQWATGDWSDCSPMSIDLPAWLERWLPGLEEDGLVIAVFPGTEEEGIVVAPQDLRQALLARQE